MVDNQTELEQAQLDAAYSKVVTRAWSDPAYKRRLMADPHAVLAEAGLTVAPDVKINVLENSDKVLNVLLPPPLEEGALSEDDLAKVAAGAACGAGPGTKGCPSFSLHNIFLSRIMTFRPIVLR